MELTLLFIRAIFNFLCRPKSDYNRTDNRPSLESTAYASGLEYGNRLDNPDRSGLSLYGDLPS